MISRALIAASSRPIILSILLGGETYGYRIIQRVREVSGGALEWSEGMLYPVLHRLERERLVSSRWMISEEGRRRKYYRLTERGRAELESERVQWMSVHHALTNLWNPMPAVD